jgi:uncharacterized HAD superfamily protein
MLVADLIGLYLNLPICDIDSFCEGRFYQTGSTRKQENWIKSLSQAKHVLVVDDSISTGDAMKEVKAKLKHRFDNIKFNFCAIYALPLTSKHADIYFATCNQPRMFEWNYMHHWGLGHACVDIDGVLCEDPTHIESLSDSKYANFLINAIPKFIPTQKVHSLVTCRDEKYRTETENWLSKYGVEYEQLIMLDDVRRKKSNGNTDYGKYKGEFYKSTNCFIFIESNYEQAVEICKVSGRQVFCVGTRKLITPDNVISHISIIQRDLRITVKRAIKKIVRKLRKK